MNEALKLAEQWKDRADDCGRLARALLAVSHVRPTTEPLTAWGDEVALLGPDKPKNDGQIAHLIRYLMTVYERFGNTAITCDLQWGSSALHVRDRQKKRIEELEALVASSATATPALLTRAANLLGAEAMHYRDATDDKSKHRYKSLIAAMDELRAATDGKAKD